MDTKDSPPPRMVSVARVSRPHGLRGEVRVAPLTDSPDRFHLLKEVVMEKPDGTLATMTVEGARGHGGLLLKFRGVDSHEQAEQLRNCYIMVRQEDVSPLPDDRFYIFDLIGYEVHNEDGDRVGTLSEVLHLPANDAYVVRRIRGEVLIPAVREFVRIDVSQRKVFVRGMGELLE